MNPLAALQRVVSVVACEVCEGRGVVEMRALDSTCWEQVDCPRCDALGVMLRRRRAGYAERSER